VQPIARLQTEDIAEVRISRRAPRVAVPVDRGWIATRTASFFFKLAILYMMGLGLLVLGGPCTGR
jgi:hypothetical protein